MNRAVVVLVTTLCVFTLFAVNVYGAGAKEDTGAAARLEDVGFHATGMPIVDKPITVEAVVQKPGQYPSFDKMSLLIELQEKSNVDIVFDEIPLAQRAEKINLMFASREFPDVIFAASVTDKHVRDAALGEDVWPLNDLIDKYAPNWKRAFEERPIIAKANTLPDGKIYSLPYYREIINDYGIRDAMAINVDWLKKVGKEIPTTTEELYQALKAFRQGIDNGTLPENGIPYAIRFHQWGNGGEWEIYNAFGLWMKGQGTNAEKYLSVNKGKVEFGATDPKLKDAMNFMHKLYSEDLISEEMFTDTFDSYTAKIRSVPPITGYRGEYYIVEAVEEWFDPLPPIAGPDGTRRYRSQPVRMQKNQFTLFKKFKYPEAMIRFIDLWADDDFSVQASYGGPMIQQNADGTRTVTGDGIEWFKHGPHGNFASYISKRASDGVKWTGVQGNRETYARDVFGPHVWPQDRHFAYISYTDEEIEDLSIISTEIFNYIKTTVAKWIVEGGVDEQWDGYVAQLDKLGLPKAMEIFQGAYDRFHGK